MKKATGLFALGLGIVFTMVACKKDQLTKYDCTGVTPTYTNDIQLIMNANCAYSGCHSATNPADGIDLSTYTKVKAEADKTAFLGAIEHKSGFETMPRGASMLPDTTIKKISCWVNNGMPQ